MNDTDIDPDILSTLTRNDSAEAALPRNLSDSVLLAIARDLRRVEKIRATHGDSNPPIARPLYLLTRLFVAESEKIADGQGCELAHEELNYWMQRFQHYIEREIVSRKIDMVCQEDSDELLVEIQQELEFS